MKTSRRTSLVIAALVAACIPATATTINVPDEQPTTQAGIDAASAGDTVLVACGTYYEHDIEMKSGVCLTSETGLADCVTIDAQQQGRVFYCTLGHAKTAYTNPTLMKHYLAGIQFAAGDLPADMSPRP